MVKSSPISLADQFQAGQLYLRRKDKALLRLVCINEGAGELYLKRVALKWSQTPRLCEAVPIAAAHLMLAAGALKLHHECVRPLFMLRTDEQILQSEQERERRRQKAALVCAKREGKESTFEWTPSPGAARLKVRDVEFSWIAPLVSVDAIAETFNPRTSRAAIKQRAIQVGCGMQVLERLVHRFAWFGLQKNALLRLDEQKGPSRGSRQIRGTEKLGRPNAFVVMNKRVTTMRGVNVTVKDEKKFEQALTKWFIGQNLTLQDTYEQMCRELYVGETRLADGTHIRRPINRRFVPAFSQFEYWQRQTWSLKRVADKLGQKDAADLRPNQVGDISIAKEVAAVFDIDATEFNRELIASFVDNNKTVNIGKATVVLVFDRRSRKVVGWYVYVGNENWQEGYRLALFRALTREAKMRRLAYLGIEQVPEYPLWVESPRPLFVYSDNGPNRSKAAKLALDQIGVAPMYAPPDTPHWKPTVEGGLGNFQRKHSRLSGGYERTRLSRNKEVRRLAKLMANNTLQQFEQKLVLQIIEYNAALNMQHMLAPEMIGVLGSADAIFSWGVGKIGGIRNRVMDEGKVYLALLDRKVDARLTKDGVRLNSAHYFCTELLQLYERGQRTVDVIVHPIHEDEVFWISPDGVLIQLKMEERDRLRIGARNTVDLEQLRVHQRMQVIEQRVQGKSPALDARQQQVLKMHDKPIRQRTSPTKHQGEYRSIQAQLNRAGDNEDRTGTYFSQVHEMGDAVKDSSTLNRPVSPAIHVPVALPLVASSRASAVDAQKSTSKPIGLPRASSHKGSSSAAKWEEEDEG